MLQDLTPSGFCFDDLLGRLADCAEDALQRDPALQEAYARRRELEAALLSRISDPQRVLLADLLDAQSSYWLQSIALAHRAGFADALRVQRQLTGLLAQLDTLAS